MFSSSFDEEDDEEEDEAKHREHHSGRCRWRWCGRRRRRMFLSCFKIDVCSEEEKKRQLTFFLGGGGANAMSFRVSIFGVVRRSKRSRTKVFFTRIPFALLARAHEYGRGRRKNRSPVSLSLSRSLSLSLARARGGSLFAYQNGFLEKKRALHFRVVKAQALREREREREKTKER